MHSESTSHGARPRFGAFLALSWLLVLAAALWQYGFPEDYKVRWGANPAGIAHFRALFNFNPDKFSPLTYSRGFAGLLAFAMLAYGLMLFVAHRTSMQMTRGLLLAAWVFTLGFATIVPAGLSCDVYAYLAYARMAVVYGLNPHVHTQFELATLHDPVAEFLQWNVPSPYGPFWTQLTILLIWPVKSLSLAVQVLVLKWLAGVALLLTAQQAAHLAEKANPGKGGLTFVAIAACPLLLIEGPGNGHNDLVMVAWLVLGVRLWQERKIHSGALCIGLSAALKFIPFLLGPWLLWMRWVKQYPRSATTCLTKPPFQT